MQYATIALSAVIGLLLAGLLGWVFALKTKGLLRILFNSLAGVILLLCLTLFKILYVPLNPVSALLVGFLGVPGVALVYVITAFL
jgi:inhibitor of the pro-sigma K processing machinery